MIQMASHLTPDAVGNIHMASPESSLESSSIVTPVSYLVHFLPKLNPNHICGDPNHLIRECPKSPRPNNQGASIGGAWSDSGKDEEENTKDETCLVAQASNEICLGINLEPEEWIKDSGCSKHMTDIYAAGSENCPPMLNKENYVPWSSRLLLYAKSRPNGKLIYNSIINGPYIDDELTEKELKQEIWLRVQQMMKGSDIGNQEKKAKLFNEWERFTCTDEESIESYYHHFSKLMNDFKRNKHFPEKIANNLKFLNNLQPEWSRHVTIVHQTKDLHTVDYTQLYDFLKYNQKEVDDLRAEQLAKTHDPLALMANSSNPFNYPVFHPDQPSPNCLTGYEYGSRQTDADGWRQWWESVVQNAVQNPSVQNVGNQNGLIVVSRIANQNPNGNHNVVAARADGNAIGNNEVNANYSLMANLQRALTSGTLTDKAPVYDSDGLAEVHTYDNCYDNEIFNMFTQEEQYTELLEPILEPHQVQHNDTNVISKVYSVEQDGGTIDQHPATVEETRAYFESLYNNLAIKVEKVNTINRKLKETNVDLTTELARYKKQEKCFDKLEWCYQKSVYQEQYLTKKINALHLSFGKQIMTLNEEISNLNNQLSKEKSTVSSPEENKNLKSDFKIYEDELRDKRIQLENKIKELDDILVKTGQSIQMMRMLSQADESLTKHKALELEIEHLLRAVVSQDIMSIMQSKSVADTSILQTELEHTKERFENCIIKNENKYAKLWNDWYKKCEECKYDKISYDKAYNDMQQKIERLQAQLGDLKGKSKDTPCVSDTLDPLSQKLESKNVELEFQVLNYAKENAHIKTTDKNLFDSISDTTKSTSVNTQFFKQSILGKPPSSSGSKLYDVTPFPKSKGLPKIDETHALSKPLTSNSVPTPQESKVVKNDNVIAPGMFRINPFKPSREEKSMPNKKDVNSNSNGFSSTGVDNTAKTRRPQPRGDTKNDRVPSASKSSCSKNKEVEVEEHPRNLLLSKNKKHMSSECNNVKLAIWNDKSEVVCAMWKQCLITANYDGNILITRVYFVESLGYNLFSVGQFCDSDLEVTFERNTCFVRNLEGVDLLKGSRTTNLYTINLHEMASASPICLMARANSTKSWLWHQRLSHLNFDIINDLARNDLVTDLPKFKYYREYLCPSCEQGKSKRASYPPKPVPNSKQRLHLLRMDFCGPMRIKITILLQAPVIVIRTDNDTEFKNQILKEYFDSVGISHKASSFRTPQQNGVVERRNRTLVEVARRMLILSRASLFLWAEATATTCYTQNRSIIHRQFGKTSYELINGKKPDISFLHVFRALRYPKNDHEDIGKHGAKGDIGFFIGYSANSCAYRVYNRMTKKIIETMNLTFDELSAMDFEQNSLKPGLQSMTFRQISSGLDLAYAPSTITTQQPTERELDLLFEAMYDDFISGQLSAAPRTTPADQAP
ncbi:retrovirus-related pol polyprotein from transposon TNT 1-94 [Tanacetum coccineum]|uniref:Retrovirus-related pol polyprotein from transposon TNT 1-94 n=1 Tax=Tanacetum coccineum TaxID=301880 RepID=A0ABQ5AWB3_9ASTR